MATERTSAADSTGTTADREIFLTRTIRAPRALVFEAFTDPGHVVEWWGPTGFSTTTQRMDVRPGGQWRFCMRGPDGREYENLITYLEVAKPERLVYKHGGASDVEPVSFEVTVTFQELPEPGSTRLTLRMLFASPQAKNFVVDTYGAIEGGEQTLNRLEHYLAQNPHERGTGREFVISRVLGAPRELVWKAWTEAESLAHWWGPKGFAVAICAFDMRPGGLCHYRLTSPEGMVIWGKWVFREIVPPDRLVFVNAFSDEHAGLGRHPMAPTWPEEMLTTVTFEAHAGIGRGTVVTVKWRPVNATAEERAMFDSGHDSMRAGWTGTFDSLAGYLAGT